MGGRIVVLVSGSGSNMAALIEACERAEVPGTVVAVAADRACRAVEIARERGIDAFIMLPGDFDTRDHWSAALRDAVVRYDPDLVVSAGFMRILSPSFVDSFFERLINLHPSLLPNFPGAHAVRDALAAGVTETGTTIHLVDHQVDHGPVITQRPVPVKAGDTVETLHERIKEVERRLLVETCRAFLEGRIRLEGDSVVVDEGAG